MMMTYIYTQLPSFRQCVGMQDSQYNITGETITFVLLVIVLTPLFMVTLLHGCRERGRLSVMCEALKASRSSRGRLAKLVEIKRTNRHEPSFLLPTSGRSSSLLYCVCCNMFLYVCILLEQTVLREESWSGLAKGLTSTLCWIFGSLILMSYCWNMIRIGRRDTVCEILNGAKDDKERIARLLKIRDSLKRHPLMKDEDVWNDEVPSDLEIAAIDESEPGEKAAVNPDKYLPSHQACGAAHAAKSSILLHIIANSVWSGGHLRRLVGSGLCFQQHSFLFPLALGVVAILQWLLLWIPIALGAYQLGKWNMLRERYRDIELEASSPKMTDMELGMPSSTLRSAGSRTCLRLLGKLAISVNLVVPIFMYSSNLYQAYDSGKAVISGIAKTITTGTAIVEITTGVKCWGIFLMVLYACQLVALSFSAFSHGKSSMNAVLQDERCYEEEGMKRFLEICEEECLEQTI
jgi:hypothetical protein